MLCKYKDIFGKVGEGVHSYRLYDIAIVDLLMTVIFAYLFNLYFNKIGFLNILIVLLVSGIILHRIFCVDTTINKLIFK